MSRTGAITLVGQEAAAGFQSYEDTNTMMSATSVSGTPSAGYFYSSITNRAQIVDLSQNLKAQFGIERIQTQSAYQLQNEFGPNGEPVWGVVNDTFGQIRLVGGGVGNTIDTYGIRIGSGVVNDYIEITFYGTGLNITTNAFATSYQFTASVDGGALGSNLIPTSSSNILQGRNTSSNQVINVFSNLTLGIHTVKIVNSLAFNIFGFEVLNESSNIIVNKGSSYLNGKKITTIAQATTPYGSTFDRGTLTAANGGRVQVIQKADGSIVKSVNSYSGSALHFPSANHTTCLEEVARVYNWREFGASRGSNVTNQFTGDDFSTVFGAGNYAFTLDDGTTSLVGSNCTVVSNDLAPNAAGDYFIFTFVGTGLDIETAEQVNGTSDTYQIYIDGAAKGTITSGTTSYKIRQICSGLPYGTHNFTLSRTTAVTGYVRVRSFRVYQPMKYGLSAGEVELADYNILGSFVANTSAGLSTIAQGVVRKLATREMIYVNGSGGTTDWSSSTVQPSGYLGGFTIYTDRQNSYFEYTFFGTGLEARFRSASDASANISVSLQSLSTGGSLLAATTANFPSLVSSFYGTGVAFASGVLDQQDGTLTNGSGVRISGLSLGLWKVRFLNNTASSFMRIEALDIITPVHSHKFNGSFVYQNTLSVGSCALSDNRKVSPVKDVISAKKNISIASGVFASPQTTSTTMYPCPDLNTTIKTYGGDLRITYSMQVENFATSNWTGAQVIVDGVTVTTIRLAFPNASNNDSVISDSVRIPIAAGYHSVQVFWRVSAGGSNYGTVYQSSRVLVVEEVQ